MAAETNSATARLSFRSVEKRKTMSTDHGNIFVESRRKEDRKPTSLYPKQRVKKDAATAGPTTSSASVPLSPSPPHCSMGRGEIISSCDIIPQGVDPQERTFERSGRSYRSDRVAIAAAPSPSPSPTCSPESSPRSTRPSTSRRRGAATPTQLLKDAFEASMSLYDSISDEDEDEAFDYLFSSAKEKFIAITTNSRGIQRIVSSSTLSSMATTKVADELREIEEEPSNDDNEQYGGELRKRPFHIQLLQFMMPANLTPMMNKRKRRSSSWGTTTDDHDFQVAKEQESRNKQASTRPS
jgi:hypothetical protein